MEGNLLNLGGFTHQPAQKTDANVKTRREKNGQCAGCGVQTHEIVKKMLGRDERVPLTKDYYHNGRLVKSVVGGSCLTCNPPAATSLSSLAQPSTAAGPLIPCTGLGTAAAASTSFAAATSPSPFHHLPDNNNINNNNNNNEPVSPQPSANNHASVGGGGGEAAATSFASPNSVLSNLAATTTTAATANYPNICPTNVYSSASTNTNTTAATINLEQANSPKHFHVDALQAASTPRQIVEALNRLNQQINKSLTSPVHEQTCVDIIAAGGIAAILTAMTAHPNHAELQRQACWALWNLALNNDNRIFISRAGGIDAIEAAIRSHLDNSRVQEKARGALRSIQG